MKETLAFLPGVPADRILARMSVSKGKELEGKFYSPDSSAFLAANVFGWFIERPELFPSLPGLPPGSVVRDVQIEYEARLPWSGGIHPQLDAALLTDTHLIGVESKRLEPFRDEKKFDLSAAYDRPLWSDRMGPVRAACQALRDGRLRYTFLDASQLVKHAFGLATRGAKLGLQPVLVYLFAEPAELHGRLIAETDILAHRAEIANFASLVQDAEVAFHALSYREWLESWSPTEPTLAAHSHAIISRFQP